ncbi:MAG: hypothetical protein KAH31_03755 [Candidatus Sabulitectum sp.]|nr:hypothetical protein [Candidatus Sabulitectum sp.]
MDGRKAALKSLSRHLLIALPFFISGIYLLPITEKKPALVFILGVMMLMVGVIVIAKPLAALLTSSASSILFPASAGREVNLMFSIAESRIMEREYDEALFLFNEMIPRDPQRLEIYLRIMNLAMEKMNRPEKAREAFQAGLKNLKNANERKILVREYKRHML